MICSDFLLLFFCSVITMLHQASTKPPLVALCHYCYILADRIAQVILIDGLGFFCFRKYEGFLITLLDKY